MTYVLFQLELMALRAFFFSKGFMYKPGKVGKDFLMTHETMSCGRRRNLSLAAAGWIKTQPGFKQYEY